MNAPKKTSCCHTNNTGDTQATDGDSVICTPVAAPTVPISRLDTLWFQVAGTICNLRCHHCFISCTPENDTFKFLSLETVRRYLEESVPLGVKEFYFTGGEPFANPGMCDILAETVQYGPATILTNATLLRQKTLDRLKAINDSTPHTIEIRVSIDGYSPELNDPIRGEGSFESAMTGVENLVARGFLPIITITRTWCGKDDEVLAGFVEILRARGYEQPRIKILPLLHLGAEENRSRSYTDCERVTHEMMEDHDTSEFLCASARIVTDKGVWVCPILIDSDNARMGDTLADAMTEYPLRHNACFTCYMNGAICSNSTTSANISPMPK